jgi:hypothetical protein
MALSLREQFKSLLEPELMEGLVDQTIRFKIHRFQNAGSPDEVTSYELGPLPRWFTLYEMKLALWNAFKRDPIYTPSLVFLGIKDDSIQLPPSPPPPGPPPPGAIEAAQRRVLGKPKQQLFKRPGQQGGADMYKPLELLWKLESFISLVSPNLRMVGPPDDRFVDSAGGQKMVSKVNRIRMTLNDIFEIDKGKTIPEIHVFLYTDLYDRIVGPRPLGERDIYGRIIPYFPFLDPEKLPDTSGQGAITPIMITQADLTAAALKQSLYLEELLVTLEGELQMPKLDGIKFLRWAWNVPPAVWEGPSILFFETPVTHERPYMRLFPGMGQPLTKIYVKGLLPIPDLADPEVLLQWKQDKNPDVGKDCMYMK